MIYQPHLTLTKSDVNIDQFLRIRPYFDLLMSFDFLYIDGLSQISKFVVAYSVLFVNFRNNALKLIQKTETT